MSESRTNGGRARSRVFRPCLDGRLEDRVLLSSAASKIKDQLALSGDLLRHPGARNGYNLKHPPQLGRGAPEIHGKVRLRAGVAATETARGGQNVEINSGGTHYMVSLSYTSNTLATNVAEGLDGQSGASNSSTSAALVSQASATYPQPVGVVRAYAMPGHRVGIIVDGSTQNTELTINPLGQQQRLGYAKSFAYGQASLGHLLNVGQLTVNTGQIGDIEGYQSAVLSGPLVAKGTTSIDRIAFDAILPGASITTGGDVNTLDVLNGITLTGTNIDIGRDLNLLNVGGSITLSNGSDFIVGRNLGLVSQPPKGTGTGTNVLTLNYTSVSNSIVQVSIPAVGSYIEGNVTVNPGSLFEIGATAPGDIDNTMYVEGTVTADFTSAGAITTSSTTVGTVSLITINGQPASLLQTELSQFQPVTTSSTADQSTTADEHYITALGGFA
jgi:hypothetical protein